MAADGDKDPVTHSQDSRLNPWLNWLLLFAVLVAAAGFADDARDTAKFGGVDLRNRVTGARQLLEGLDPYHFKWTSDYSEKLLDPNDSPNFPVTMVTVPPTVLALQAPVASLPYKAQRAGWFALQWATLIASTAMLAHVTGSREKRKAIWIVGLLFIGGSLLWRLHVERGQIYILYVFLLAAAIRLSQSRFSGSALASGFLLGMTAALRPPAALMLLPMLIYRKWKMLAGSVAGAITTLGASFLLADISIWRSYFSVTKTWSDIFQGVIAFDYAGYGDRVIEGMYTLTYRSDTPTYDSSLQAVLQPAGLNLSSLPLLAVLTLVVAAAVIFLLKVRRADAPLPLLFLAGSVLVLISEFFLPARRYTYNDIIWLIPLSLIIISSGSLVSLLKRPQVILLVIALIFGVIFWISDSMVSYGVVISDYAMVFYLSATAVSLFWRRYAQLRNV